MTWGALAWIVGISVGLAALAFVVLKVLALAVARRVAESTERRLAQSVHDGLSRSGLALPAPISSEQRARQLAQIQRLARLMDCAVPLPIIGGIGLDAVLGLVPIAGDLVALGISSTIVLRAAQLGASPEVISRLVAIQCTDLLLGAIPIVGDLVDAAYHANVRSVRLLTAAMGDVAPASRA